MVKPKGKLEIRLEDYFYLDEYGVLRWKQRYGKMRQGDKCGSSRNEVCFRGVYYSVALLTEAIKVLPSSNTMSVKKIADSKMLPGWMNFKRPETTSYLSDETHAQIGPKEGSTGELSAVDDVDSSIGSNREN